MSCVTIPTLTTTQVQTSQSTQTIVTSSVSTAAPLTSVITSVSTSCPAVDGSSATATCTPSVKTVTITTVIPGSAATVAVTQTEVVQVTNTILGTLFSTSCAAGATPSQGTPTTVETTERATTSTNTNADTGTGIVTGTGTGTSTSPTSTQMSTSTLTSTSTAADGSVIILTETSTFSQTSSSTASAGADGGSSSGSHHVSPSNLGAIIGGSVGGILGLAAIVFIIWLLLKRRNRWDDIFEGGDEQIAFPVPTRDPPPETKPKPYEYGLVGHAPVPPPHFSPPSSDSGAPATAYSDLPQPPPRPLESYQQQQQIGHSQGLTHGRLISVSSTAIGHRPSTQSSVGSGAFDAVQGLGGGPIPIPPPNNAWAASGSSGRQLPGIQRNVQGGTSGGQPGPSFVGGEPDTYGAVETDSSVAGPSAAASVSTHTRSHPSLSGSIALGHAPAPAAGPSAGFEYDPYQEQQQQALQQARERRDGKGRLVTTGEKRPIVHLDGGRYREPGATTGTPAPPAYSA